MVRDSDKVTTVVLAAQLLVLPVLLPAVLLAGASLVPSWDYVVRGLLGIVTVIVCVLAAVGYPFFVWLFVFRRSLMNYRLTLRSLAGLAIAVGVSVSIARWVFEYALL